MSNPTPTRRDGEATRQRLLRAALELYTTVGFRATTTPAIAARAGVAEGTIYRHFSGKEHLLNEVYRNAQRWGAGLVRETGAERPPLGARPARRHRPAAARRGRAGSVAHPHAAPQPRRAAPRRAEPRGLARVPGRAAAGGGGRRGRRRRCAQGPPELWTDVWLALVAFAAERVGARDWEPESPQSGSRSTPRGTLSRLGS